MRTNIEIDDGLMEEAMKAGPYKTKKDAVEAGLKLLKRQAAYREILKWRGKLKWEGDESIDWVAANRAESPELPLSAQERTAEYRVTRAAAKPAAAPAAKKVRRARR